MLWDQVQIKRVLFQECLTKVILSLNGGHIKGGEPLEGRTSETLLEHADQKPLISLKLCEVTAIRPQMGNGTSLTVILIKVRDLEVWWEYYLWKVVEVPKLEGLAIAALH